MDELPYWQSRSTERTHRAALALCTAVFASIPMNHEEAMNTLKGRLAENFDSVENELLQQAMLDAEQVLDAYNTLGTADPHPLVIVASTHDRQ